jgi:undecaprenyl-diphosphatase
MGREEEADARLLLEDEAELGSPAGAVGNAALQNIDVMTTTWPTVRAPVVPVLLLGAAIGFVLANDTTSPDAARSFAGTVADWPAWAHDAVATVSERGLVVLGLLLAVSAWRARSRGPRQVATAVLGGTGVVLALAASELLKVLTAQDRPCREVADLDAVVPCPPVGDWSLPSNHATLAAALAAALIWSAPRWWPLVVSLASLVAAARVALGVHYPHDVVDGLVLGALVSSATVLLLRRPATHWVTAGRRVPLLRAVLSDGSRPMPSDAGDRAGAA